MTTYLTQEEYRELKRKLSLRVNRVKRADAAYRKAHPNGPGYLNNPDDPRVELWVEVAKEAQRGLDRFDQVVGPDDWHRWQVALDDARFALRWVGVRVMPDGAVVRETSVW